MPSLDYEYWRCTKIFFDESWITLGTNKTVLILGALICPPGGSIESDLEQCRQYVEYINEIKSSNLSGDKALELAKLFFNTFIESKAIFRAIIFPKKHPEFSEYCNGKEWQLVAKSIKVLLNNLWVCDDKRTRIIRPKIILDFNQSYEINKEIIEAELLSSLRFNEEFSGSVFRRFPGAEFTLLDSKIFESLQLVDILVASIKWDLREPENEEKRDFKDYVKKYFNQNSLYGIARWNTGNKFDSWLFKESKDWIDEGIFF